MLTATEYIVGFAGLVTVASLWNIFGGDMFPAEKDPTGGKNEDLLYSADSLLSRYTTGPEATN